MRRENVIEYTERWAIGGIERYIVNLARGLDRERFAVTVLASQKESDFFDEELASCGCAFASLREGEAQSDPIRRVLGNMRRMAEYLRAHPCDVLHLHVCQGVALRYARIARKCGVARVIAHCHNAEMGEGHHLLKYAAHMCCRSAYGRCLDERLACSDAAARWLYPRGALASARVCRSLVDVERFRFSPEARRALRQRFGLDGERVYLAIGRLHSQKNPEFLLDIFDALAELDPSCRMVWIGTGEMRDALRSRASALGLDERLSFIDSTPEVADYMSMADAFLLPSLYEGNPIVAAEAQASGLRCYLSDAITREAGLLEGTRFLSLKEPPRAWAERMRAEAPLTAAEREACADIVRARGYDAEKQIREMERLYSLR